MQSHSSMRAVGLCLDFGVCAQGNILLTNNSDVKQRRSVFKMSLDSFLKQREYICKSSLQNNKDNKDKAEYCGVTASIPHPEPR